MLDLDERARASFEHKYKRSESKTYIHAQEQTVYGPSVKQQ